MPAVFFYLSGSGIPLTDVRNRHCPV